MKQVSCNSFIARGVENPQQVAFLLNCSGLGITHQLVGAWYTAQLHVCSPTSHFTLLSPQFYSRVGIKD